VTSLLKSAGEITDGILNATEEGGNIL